MSDKFCKDCRHSKRQIFDFTEMGLFGFNWQGLRCGRALTEPKVDVVTGKVITPSYHRSCENVRIFGPCYEYGKLFEAKVPTNG